MHDHSGIFIKIYMCSSMYIVSVLVLDLSVYSQLCGHVILFDVVFIMWCMSYPLGMVSVFGPLGFSIVFGYMICHWL
jgi:hypothetical protein